MDKAQESKTVLRVRIAHVHTLKDGWRLSETTVEATGIVIDREAMRVESQLAYENGVEEAKRRNQLERSEN